MRAKVTFETVRKIGLQLPDVEESATFGKPALKVHGKMFACMASHKSAEPDSLVVRTDFEQRAELLAADPDVYYITGHYEGYPSVLVRLSRVKASVLPDVLAMAYGFVVRKEARGVKKKKAP